MTSKMKFFAIAVALIALPAIVVAVPGTMQHEEHHPDAAMQGQDETMMEGQGEAMAREEDDEWSCPVAGRMMAMMQRHMEMMQGMMSHMRGGMMMHAGEGEMPMDDCPMHGRMSGKMGAGMHGMMGDFDPAAIEDPEKAEKMAEMLRSRAERMKAHLQKVDERAAALEARAEELRSGSGEGS